MRERTEKLELSLSFKKHTEFVIGFMTGAKIGSVIIVAVISQS